MTKTCIKCREDKPLDCFTPPRTKCKSCINIYNRAWRLANLDKWKDMQRRYRKKNPEKFNEYRRQWHRNYPEKSRLSVKKSRLKSSYGLTWEAYQKMVAVAAGRCSICFEATEKLVVDHNHETGRVRGLLCNLCNAGLGCFRDDPEVMVRASQYLSNEGANVVDQAG